MRTPERTSDQPALTLSGLKPAGAKTLLAPRCVERVSGLQDDQEDTSSIRQSLYYNHIPAALRDDPSA